MSPFAVLNRLPSYISSIKGSFTICNLTNTNILLGQGGRTFDIRTVQEKAGHRSARSLENYLPGALDQPVGSVLVEQVS